MSDKNIYVYIYIYKTINILVGHQIYIYIYIQLFDLLTMLYQACKIIYKETKQQC